MGTQQLPDAFVKPPPRVRRNAGFETQALGYASILVSAQFISYYISNIINPTPDTYLHRSCIIYRIADILFHASNSSFFRTGGNIFEQTSSAEKKQPADKNFEEQALAGNPNTGKSARQETQVHETRVHETRNAVRNAGTPDTRPPPRNP